MKNLLCRNKDKGGSRKIFGMLDMTMLVLTVVCFLSSHYEHIQSNTMKTVLNNVSYITGIYSTVLLGSKIIVKLKESFNENVLARHKKRDFSWEKASLQLKRFSSQVLTDTTAFVKTQTITLFLIITLVVMVYYTIFVIYLLLKII